MARRVLEAEEGGEKMLEGVALALSEHFAGQAEEMLKSSSHLEVRPAGRRLPQRGCVCQPRVAATPLPWDFIRHVINPNGVTSGEGSHYAAIVIIRSGRIPGAFLHKHGMEWDERFVWE